MDTYLAVIQTVLSASEQFYRKVQQCLRSTTADRPNVINIARLVRELTASLYQIHLFLSTEEHADIVDSVGECMNLNHLHQYEQGLNAVDESIDHALSQGNLAWPLDPLPTESLNQVLAAVLAQYSLALEADHPLAALRALSKAEPPARPGLSDAGVHLPERVFLKGSEIMNIKVRCTPDPIAVAQWSDTRLNTYLRLRTPGSLDLTMQNPVVQSWLEGKTNRLWLHGDSGSGKTVLASTVLERLITDTKHDPTTAVCYHFFESKPWGTGAKPLLAGLVGQLARQNPKADQYLRMAFSPHLIKDKTRLPPWIQDTVKVEKWSLREDTEYLGRVINLLRGFFRRVVFVIDGPDVDVQTGMEALVQLHMYSGVLTPNRTPLTVTSMLVLSREPSDEDGVSRLRHTGYEILDITPAPAQIQMFVEQRLQERTRVDPSVTLDREEINRILETISCKTIPPSFRAAELQLDHILSFSSGTKTAAELSGLPADLGSSYELLTGRLPGHYEHELVCRTMQWLQELGPAELTLGQLCGGLSIFLSKDATSLADVRVVWESQLLYLCAILVRRTLDGSTIEVSHRSFHEFRPAHTENVRYEVSNACLRLLNFHDFRHDPTEYRVEQYYAKKRDGRLPFYHYAALAWFEVLPAHDSVSSAARQDYMDQACKLFSSRPSGNLMSWLLEVGRQRLVAIYGLSPALTFLCLTRICNKSSTSPLHIAACFGLAHLCDALVRNGADVNLKSDIGTPLYCALAGPAILLSVALTFDWRVAQKSFRLDSRLDTAETLINLGARREGIPSGSSINPSFAAVALMACAARFGTGDVKLFASLCSEDQYLKDKDFLATFQDPTFLKSESADDAASIPRRKQFLNDLCILLLDGAWEKQSYKIRFAVWNKGFQLKLDCISPTTRRQLPFDDDTFSKCVQEAVRTRSELLSRRLMQDSRWDSNLPLPVETEEDRGRTLLHLAVEDGRLPLARLLLEYARANVSVRDASGRTPLHLCESSDMLRLLIEHGAELRQVDNDGRLLWHYAAANNDWALLRTLVEVDNDTDRALKQTTNQGRTPLAESFAYILELVGKPPVPGRGYHQYLARQTQSIHFLLDLTTGDDPAYFRSDIPLVCYAAEWGIPTLLTKLRHKCPGLDLTTSDGSGPLHFLNFWGGATSKMVRTIKRIPGVAELPVLDRNGHSPAETIFLTFKSHDGEFLTNAHPSHYGELDRSAFMELLTEDVCRSLDQQGRTLWQRFSNDIILYYAAQERDGDNWDRIRRAKSMAVDCFIEKGVINESESSLVSASWG